MRFPCNVAMLALAAGANAQLNKLAVSAGFKYFGSATDNGELDDTAYTAILSDADEFGQITPGNTQKWAYTEPEQDTFDFSKGDVVASFAQNNSQLLRCHTLVWYNQLPSWVTSGSWTNETLIDALKTHITNEVEHYAGQCYAWDVVNEAVSDSGDGSYRDNIFYSTIGESYIPIAFAAAAAADADAKLYYNDYSIEYTGSKLTAALAIVDLVQGAASDGARIDGVGLQGHFIVGQVGSAAGLAGVLEQFTAKGVEVAYTEVDVRHQSLPANDSAVEQQAQDYAAVVAACLQVDGCVGVTVWDFYDKYSWIPDTFSGQGEACLYDDNLSKKPAWTSVSSVLAAAATGGVASSNSSSTTGAARRPASSAAGASGAGAAAATPAATPAPSAAPAGACTRKTKTVYVTASSL